MLEIKWQGRAEGRLDEGGHLSLGGRELSKSSKSSEGGRGEKRE